MVAAKQILALCYILVVISDKTTSTAENHAENCASCLASKLLRSVA